ncbi:N-acetyl-gamma-glutamyl-phosphate reductase [Thalassobaculum litoreum]|uniref:N-acetyl-gamma-glutamyl-phosphate reductase n=1 Tax=Thalassobaculum litoreum DSM 18839 TaxID=1123362 RepID=A0A8G2BE42_9PROT|nr:N-acetyl-gamma-glutamyl-phosphate reductase [Thalassobaculum litoreum]SDF12050.1 N-acetyl-gamma-glutamyl-phosphate reductase [Thalassobaculum litoreum DSM 18839]
MGSARVFIDGEAGTTGLQIRERLLARRDIELISLSGAERKDAKARRDALHAADVAILCLPDDAAREAAALAEGADVKLIDASTAHRTADGWVYGFPEFRAGQREAVIGADRISNPGCYSTGAIAILAPLVAAHLLPVDYPVTVNAVSGYTGGGKSLIARYEAAGEAGYKPDPFWNYGLTLNHKHVPEITRWTGLGHPPIFQPSVARYAQGMLVSVPLALWSVESGPTAAAAHEILLSQYADTRFVRVAPLGEAEGLKELDPQALNGTNMLEIFVFSDEETGRAVITARLDNLGKGASGAAVQNMNLLLGMPEDAGIEASAAA